MSTALGLVVGLFLLLLTPFTLGCQDEQGRSVDYFLLYKVPKLENSPNTNIRSGLGYAFVTANSADKWQLSNRSIGDPKSMLGTTLKTLFGNGKNNVLLYNDQPPQSCELEGLVDSPMTADHD
ncbi:Deoxyribonuclease II [Tyrophagus putrescentiae]|nr:Deoxyribonuclease II [Tyrophagus putrescentiae]